MIPLHCPHCGAELEGEQAAQVATAQVKCLACGLAVQVRTGESALAVALPASGGAGSSSSTTTARLETSDYGTLFQPRALLEESLERRASSQAAAGPAGTQPLARPDEPPRLPRPTRPAYLLRVGAPAGAERLPVPSALAVLGREGADIDLGDPSVSVRHCQIEAIGDEFFVRDLASRNGTYLNGARIRYAELRPGDQLRAGRTVLVFRAENDGV